MKKTSKKAPAKKTANVAPAAKVAVKKEEKYDIIGLISDLGMSLAWGMIASILFGLLSFSYIIWANATPSEFLKFDLMITMLGVAAIVFYYKRK